jgi:hypothetical protein
MGLAIAKTILTYEEAQEKAMEIDSWSPASYESPKPRLRIRIPPPDPDVDDEDTHPRKIWCCFCHVG